MADQPRDKDLKLIATNPHAFSNYSLSDIVEAGLQLTGTEVKSMRDSSPNIRDAFVEVRRKGGSLEAYLVNAHIAHYSHGNIANHEPERARKLLLHRHQIEQLHGAITRDGMTVIPIRLYFRKGMAKVEIAIGKGKKKHDKREDIKRRTADREMDQAIKSGKKGRD